MRQSIKNIGIYGFVWIAACVAIAFTITHFTENKSQNTNTNGIGIESRTININIAQDNINFNDTIVFAITNSDLDYQIKNDNNILSHVNMTINGHMYWSDILALNHYLDIPKELLQQSYSNGGNMYVVDLSYIMPSSYITAYTDINALTYYISDDNLDFFKNLTINVTSDIAIDNLNVENADVTKPNNYQYKISKSNINKTITIPILFNSSSMIGTKSSLRYSDTLQANNSNKSVADISFMNDRIPIIVGLSIFSIILMLIAFIINHKRRVYNFRRDYEDLIPPILAETIVDEKTGMKELLMVSIIELSLKGNLSIIDNNHIQLLNYDNLENYERSILELLFKNSNSVTFQDINNIFVQSNLETLAFTDNINEIKESIIEKIFGMNLFSKSLSIINKIFNILSIVLIINFPLVFISPFTLESIIWFTIIFNAVVLIFYVRSTLNSTTIREEIIKNEMQAKSRINFSSIIVGICPLVLISMGIVDLVQSNLTYLFVMIVVVGINIFTAYITRKKVVLTKKGRLEQQKLLELKKYILENSLMKDRDLQSTIVWDKYLAYATAFGISNRITDSIYSQWYNLNLNLQVIDLILRA